MIPQRQNSWTPNRKALVLAAAGCVAMVVGLNHIISASAFRPTAESSRGVAAATAPTVAPPQRDYEAEVRAKPYLDYVRNPDAAVQHLREIAQKSGGDITRVSPEDRAWLDRMTRGRAAEVVRGMKPARQEK